MGLFSKLFSGAGEDPTQTEGQDAQATASGGEGVTKGDESAAGAKDARARSATTPDKAEPTPPTAAGDKKPAAAGGAKPPPLDAAKSAQAKKPDGAKRDGAAPARPPATMGSTGIAGRPTGQLPTMADPDKAKKPSPAGAIPAVQVRPAPEHVKGKPKPPPAAGPGDDEKTTPLTTTTAAAAAAAVVAAPVSGANRPSNSPLEAAVDAALNALMAPQSPGDKSVNNDNAHDQRAVAETFADMAKVHAHPLRELMFQLSVGRTPKQWAAACRPVLRPLFDAATQIGMLELVGALGAFDAALERAAAEPTSHIGEAAVEALTAAYDRLRQQMPDAFTPPDRADSRRLILLESLLLQVPSMQRRTLSKLYAAGVSSLAQLSQAEPSELSAVAGIDRELAQAIVTHVQRFERERNRVNPAAFRSYVQERLRSIVGRLNQLQAEFESAELAESNERKRTARQGREAAVLELDLLFAEVGDVDLIEQLKRCPVRDKIKRVESYLEQMQTSA
ncbi:MAG TPA: helix-hairpin-helix domain-containing protein [Polyangiales bacterium]|nr:helix-hairpin-helix domain-containing protein [Polyangiales bacterium]